jgi:hypothetical protein
MAYNESNASANAANDARCAQCNSGYLRIYSGTQPANADTALSGNTLLAELRFGATAFGSSSNGVATANATTQDSSADNTGTPTWFRALKSDGTTVVLDGTAGASGCDLNLSNLNAGQIIAGGAVSVTSLTVTQTPH